MAHPGPSPKSKLVPSSQFLPPFPTQRYDMQHSSNFAIKPLQSAQTTRLPPRKRRNRPAQVDAAHAQSLTSLSNHEFPPPPPSLWFLPRDSAFRWQRFRSCGRAPGCDTMDGYDSEDFSSSEEDEDYVPSGGEYSEDDVNELVKEDEVENEEEPQENKGKKRNSKDTKTKSLGITPRKRKKGGLLMEDKEETEDKVEIETEGKSDEEEEKTVEQEKSIPSEEEKKRQDDALWASFLSDVGPRSQPRPPRSQTKTEGESQEKSSDKSLATAKESDKPSEREKVKITKVFDFAGEEVRVTKEVDAASKEAKSFFKQNEKEKPQTGVPSAPSALPTGSGLKRPSGMSSLLGKIGAKKQKMSTLEKSKLDWESFKEEEGIGEELAIHNRGKEGYIERKAFLERVDHRQFEIERDLRLSKMKP